MRVSALADTIGVDGKLIRRFLRSKYGSSSRIGTKWDLSQEQVGVVREYFGQRGPATPSDSPVIPRTVLKCERDLPSLRQRVRELRTSPQDVIVEVEGGAPLAFHIIMGRWVDYGRRGRSSSVVALLSNGTFLDSKGDNAPQAHLMEPQFAFLLRGGKYQEFHVNYVNRLRELSSIPLKLVEMLTKGARQDDTPQGLLIENYTSYIYANLRDMGSLLDWESISGRRCLEAPLSTVMGWKPTSPRSSPSWGSKGTDIELAIRRFLTTINLLREFPGRPGAFDVTIGEVYQRFFVEISGRANNLRDEVSERLGFAYQEGRGWFKSKGADRVDIGDDLSVRVNRKSICVVSRQFTPLPYGDEVARRMLTVATAHRDQISTFHKEEREVLERLFPIGSDRQPL